MHTVQALFSENTLIDIVVQRKPPMAPLHMLGGGGQERELRILPKEPLQNALPIFVGSGLGHALKAFLATYTGPLAVIDKEQEILTHTHVKERLEAELSPEQRAQILWISPQKNGTVQEVLRQLTQWQKAHNKLPFLPIIHPFYQRLDKDWYGPLRQHLEASQQVNFWAKVRKPRFCNDAPRLLLITSKYFLMGELASACERLGIAHRLLTIPDESVASSEFIKDFLTAVNEFQPDCLLTLNHLGVDREGLLMELLEQLELPLASWFVDNPHLIVHLYEKLKSPWVSIFSWDLDNINSLKDMGFEHVFYLPLGTNTHLFSPAAKGKASWKSRISFVGNSMLYKVQTRLGKTPLPAGLLQSFEDVAHNFGQSYTRSIANFLQESHAKEWALYADLPSDEVRLGYETALTWEATRIYRASCVEQILPFSPLIVGDDGWDSIFATKKSHFTLHPVLSYYTDLPGFYPLSDINFNCTSKQMKGAVNQRIFDVPACNAFVLTDWREQMDNLFEPHKEIAFYTEPEEAPDLVRYYLAHPEHRQSITTAARRRVLAEHTWDHRLQSLLQHMRSVYGIKGGHSTHG